MVEQGWRCSELSAGFRVAPVQGVRKRATQATGTWSREDDGPTRLPVARRRQYGYEAKELSDLIGERSKGAGQYGDASVSSPRDIPFLNVLMHNGCVNQPAS